MINFQSFMRKILKILTLFGKYTYMIKYFQAFLAFDCDHRNMVSLIFMIASLQLSLSRYLEQRLDSKMTMGWDIDEVAGEIQIRLKVIHN